MINVGFSLYHKVFLPITIKTSIEKEQSKKIDRLNLENYCLYTFSSFHHEEGMPFNVSLVRIIYSKGLNNQSVSFQESKKEYKNYNFIYQIVTVAPQIKTIMDIYISI